MRVPIKIAYETRFWFYWFSSRGYVYAYASFPFCDHFYHWSSNGDGDGVSYGGCQRGGSLSQSHPSRRLNCCICCLMCRPRQKREERQQPEPCLCENPVCPF